MSSSDRRSGSIPPHHRRLAIWVAAGFFVVLLGAGLLLKLAAGVGIPWFWIIVTPVFATGLIALFLWVRLSD